MGAFFTGTANRMTLSRLLCLFFVLWAIFDARHGVYFVGAAAFTVACILDKLDGYWAWHVAKNPTVEGQFLDQFVDKLFLWPIWGAIAWREVFLFHGLWSVLSLVLIVLDVRSCVGHYRAYRRDRAIGRFNPNHGAVLFGKLKFFFQMFMVGSYLGSRWPVVGWNGQDWFYDFSRLVQYAGEEITVFAPMLVMIAVVLASTSLLTRSKLEVAVVAAA